MLDGRNEPIVLKHVLLPDQTGGEFPPIRFAFECHAKDLLAQEDAEAVVQQEPMACVSHVGLGLIKPVVDLYVIVSLAAEAAGR